MYTSNLRDSVEKLSLKKSSQMELQSSEEEITTRSCFESTDDSLGRMWVEKMDMLWELKYRMQRMDDLGVELSRSLTEFVFLLQDNGDDVLLINFLLFAINSWSSAANRDRLASQKAVSVMKTAHGFLVELNKRQKETGKDEEDSKRLALNNREIHQLSDDIRMRFLDIEDIMILLQKNMRTTDEYCLESLDHLIEICKKKLGGLKETIEKLKKDSQIFSAFSSEMDEFWNGNFELEMTRLWNTSWDLEDIHIFGNSAENKNRFDA